MYHRDEERDGHHDWQLTAVDFRTGWPVFSIKGWFTDEEFNDNVSGMVRKRTLGKDDYGRKVLNNIWATFSFGPENSVFLGAYRGYIRISSDPELTVRAEEAAPEAAPSASQETPPNGEVAPQ